jgi:RNA polymerase sigma-70 factor (ECF subfamily)
VTASTEADQIAAARQGDDAAFERLVAAHQARLHAYCYRMPGSVHDADDALQEPCSPPGASLYCMLAGN